MAERRRLKCLGGAGTCGSAQTRIHAQNVVARASRVETSRLLSRSVARHRRTDRAIGGSKIDSRVYNSCVRACVRAYTGLRNILRVAHDWRLRESRRCGLSIPLSCAFIGAYIAVEAASCGRPAAAQYSVSCLKYES